MKTSIFIISVVSFAITCSLFSQTTKERLFLQVGHNYVFKSAYDSTLVMSHVNINDAVFKMVPYVIGNQNQIWEVYNIQDGTEKYTNIRNKATGKTLDNNGSVVNAALVTDGWLAWQAWDLELSNDAKSIRFCHFLERWTWNETYQPSFKGVFLTSNSTGNIIPFFYNRCNVNGVRDYSAYNSAENHYFDFKPRDPVNVIVTGEIVTVKPEIYNTPFRNPMMGWRDVFSVGLDPIPSNYPLPYGSIYKEYIPWDKIENNDSDGVDKIVAYSNHRWAGIESKNIKVIPRVYIHWLGTPPVNDPDKIDGVRFPSDIPWCCATDEYPKTNGYFASNFQSRVAALVKKMGEAWDNDPRVAYVEMGIIGQWAEQHDPSINTYWKPHTYPDHIANVTWIPGIEKTLGDAFTAAFKNKKIMVRYAYDFKDYKFGYHWDSWGVAEEDTRGYAEMMKMGDRWKTQPTGGEICWNWGDLSRYNSLNALLANTDTRNKIIKQIRDLHCNHLGYFSYARPTVDFSDPALLVNAQILQKALGYRFILSEFTYNKKINYGNTFDISFKVKNEGSSPFYYDWPVEISLLNKTTKEKVWSSVLNDVKTSQWMPGENWDNVNGKYLTEPTTYEIDRTLTLDTNLPSDEYIIAISVLDPAGMMPSLRFATLNYFTGGRHPMGYIGVGKEISNYQINSSEFNNIYTDSTLSYQSINSSNIATNRDRLFLEVGHNYVFKSVYDSTLVMSNENINDVVFKMVPYIAGNQNQIWEVYNIQNGTEKYTNIRNKATGKTIDNNGNIVDAASLGAGAIPWQAWDFELSDDKKSVRLCHFLERWKWDVTFQTSFKGAFLTLNSSENNVTPFFYNRCNVNGVRDYSAYNYAEGHHFDFKPREIYNQNQVSSNLHTIYTGFGSIVFENTTGQNIDIYSVDGRLIKQFTSTSSYQSASIKKGVYIVKFNNEIHKVIVN